MIKNPIECNIDIVSLPLYDVAKVTWANKFKTLQNHRNSINIIKWLNINRYH